MAFIDRLEENRKEWTKVFVYIKNNFDMSFSEMKELDIFEFFNVVDELERIVSAKMG